MLFIYLLIIVSVVVLWSIILFMIRVVLLWTAQCFL